jgi:hypothetical protein
MDLEPCLAAGRGHEGPDRDKTREVRADDMPWINPGLMLGRKQKEAVGVDS